MNGKKPTGYWAYFGMLFVVECSSAWSKFSSGGVVSCVTYLSTFYAYGSTAAAAAVYGSRVENLCQA